MSLDIFHNAAGTFDDSSARRFTKSRPCPVCGSGTKGCSRSADGPIFCRGAADPPDGFFDLGPAAKNPEWRVFKPATSGDAAPPPARPPKPPPPVGDWGATADEWRRNLTPAKLAEIAADLGLPTAALVAVGVGNCPPRYMLCEWSFPERDGSGKVVGMNLRGKLGQKIQAKGGNRGLILPDGWRDRPGPLYLVEGASGAAAMTAAGLPAVGRPSNLAGVQFLLDLLADWPADRPVVVVGDNDLKPTGEWPGLRGAESVAKQLGRSLPARVFVGMPPEGFKDCRDWLIARTEPWPERGRILAETIRVSYKPALPAAEPAAPPAECGEPYQPFPVERLPGPLTFFVREVARTLDCDQAFVAIPLLAAVAALIGNARGVRLRREWVERSILWTATVASSGAMKTATMKVVMAPIREQEERLAAEFRRQWAEYREAAEAWKHSEEEGRGDPPRKPCERRLTVQDITLERLVEELGNNPRGVFASFGELGSWFGSFQRYKSGGGSDAPQWLVMNDGDTLRYDRKHGDPRTVYVPRAAVSLTGTIQPGTLRKLLGQEYLDNGLAARCLWAMPPEALEGVVRSGDRRRSHRGLCRRRRTAGRHDRRCRLRPLAGSPSPLDRLLQPDVERSVEGRRSDAGGVRKARTHGGSDRPDPPRRREPRPRRGRAVGRRRAEHGSGDRLGGLVRGASRQRPGHDPRIAGRG